MKKYLLVVFASLLAFCTLAQGEMNNWYFGNQLGITFNTEPPTPLYDNAMVAAEASAVMSDSIGNLLLYSNGIQIRDNSHTIITNGNFLNGGGSSKYGTLIIPAIANKSQYYIFTTDAEETPFDGFNYSIIELIDSEWEVTEKNIPLLEDVSEPIMAIKHCNGIDIWIVVHGFNDNLFYCYLLTQNSLEEPIITSAGQINASGRAAAMKCSTSGNLFFFSGCNDYSVIDEVLELFHFDNETGIPTSYLTLDSTYTFDSEFSLNGKYLYSISLTPEIAQYNLEAGNSLDIINSKTSIPTNQNQSGITKGMDKKIYSISLDYTLEYNYLNVIHNPDTIATAINFQDSVVLSYSTGIRNFPNIPHWYYWDNYWEIEPDCSDTTSHTDTTTAVAQLHKPKQLLRIVDVLGRESKPKPNVPLFYIYTDGTVEKKIVISDSFLVVGY